MQLEALGTDLPRDVQANVLVVGIYEEDGLSGPARRLDEQLGGLLDRLYQRGDISGKRHRWTPLLGVSGIQAEVLVVLGLGKKSDWNRASASRAGGVIGRSLNDRQYARVAIWLEDDLTDEAISDLVAGVMIGGEGQALYRTDNSEQGIETLRVAGASAAALKRGKILGESINLTRRLVNEPPSELTPVAFAKEAEKVAQRCGLGIEIWDEAKLVQERCGAMLAVARGSAAEPRLVIVSYQGTGAGDTIALVGKGVTFDSGGLSLKPSDSMKTMKCDMAGAATVLGTIQAIAQLQLPVNVIGLMGLVENMPGHEAFRLGDVLTARNGTTIEVLNTDAEGRLVLADVLSVAVERGVDKIIDLATLTGACVVALGTDVAGAMTNNQQLCDQILAAAEKTGERLWQLPMFSEFDEQIKSDVADIKNIGNGRWGGAITAAKFLERFVANVPWVHLDIAGPAFLERPKPWIDGGGTGACVTTLVELLSQ
jgi:leucyl aminopeptidase